MLNLLKKKESIVRRNVELAMGIAQATAVLILREMIEKDLLKRHGYGKLVRYSLGE